MPSRCKSSMSFKKKTISSKKRPVKENIVQENELPTQKKSTTRQKAQQKTTGKIKGKATPSRSSRKNSAKTPEDAILQSSAVDPDLEKAVKPKKATKKKAPIPPKTKVSQAKKDTISKKARAKKTKNASK
jgi:hypothetical protein